MKKVILALAVSISLAIPCAAQQTAAAQQTPPKPGVLSGHTDYVRAVAVSPDGKTAASGSTDKTIILWNLATREKKTVLTGHSGFVQSLAFSPDGKLLLSGSSDGTMKLWDAETGAVVRTYGTAGNDTWIYGVAFTPDGKNVLSGISNGALRLWSVADAPPIRLYTGHKGKYIGVHAVAISPDGKTIASGSEDQTIRIWNLATGANVRTITGFTETVNAVAFSPDGKRILAGSGVYSANDKSLKLFDVSSGKEIAAMSPGGEVRAVAFLPDGKTAIAGGARLNLWDIKKREQIRSYSGHEKPVNAIAIAPDASVFLTASDDGTVRIWNAREKPAIPQAETPYGEFNYLIAEGKVDKIYYAAKWLFTEKKDKERFRRGLDAMLAQATENPDPAVRKDALSQIYGDIDSPMPPYLGPAEAEAIYATAKSALENDPSAGVRQSALDIVYAFAKTTGKESYVRDILGAFKRDADPESLHLAARQIMWLKDGGIALPVDARQTIEAAAMRFLMVQKPNAAWACIASSGFSLPEYPRLIAEFRANAMPDRPFVCSVALDRIDGVLTYKAYADALAKDPETHVNLLALRYLINKSVLDPTSALTGMIKSQEYKSEQRRIDAKAESMGTLEEQLMAKIKNLQNENMAILMEGSVDMGLEQTYREDILEKLVKAGGYPALLKPLVDMTDPSIEQDAARRASAWKALARCYQDADGNIVEKLPKDTIAALALNAKKEKDASTMAVAKIVTSEMAK